LLACSGGVLDGLTGFALIYTQRLDLRILVGDSAVQQLDISQRRV
jgi:hypothetical protein